MVLDGLKLNKLKPAEALWVLVVGGVYTIDLSDWKHSDVRLCGWLFWEETSCFIKRKEKRQKEMCGSQEVTLLCDTGSSSQPQFTN